MRPKNRAIKKELRRKIDDNNDERTDKPARGIELDHYKIDLQNFESDELYFIGSVEISMMVKSGENTKRVSDLDEYLAENSVSESINNVYSQSTLLEQTKTLRCSDCGGTGKIDCSECSGSGLVSCRKCDSEGVRTWYDDCPKCDSKGQLAGGECSCRSSKGPVGRVVVNKEQCRVCEGGNTPLGKKKCQRCNKNNRITCGKCGGDQVEYELVESKYERESITTQCCIPINESGDHVPDIDRKFSTKEGMYQMFIEEAGRDPLAPTTDPVLQYEDHISIGNMQITPMISTRDSGPDDDGELLREEWSLSSGRLKRDIEDLIRNKTVSNVLLNTVSSEDKLLVAMELGCYKTNLYTVEFQIQGDSHSALGYGNKNGFKLNTELSSSEIENKEHDRSNETRNVDRAEREAGDPLTGTNRGGESLMTLIKNFLVGRD